MSHPNTLDVIRAWKDPEYRLSLSETERAQLPDHPAGTIELTDAELGSVTGGFFGGSFGFDAAQLLAASGTCGSHHKCCPQSPPELALNPDTLKLAGTPGALAPQLWW